MSNYIPRGLLDNDPYKDSELTYRASLLPMGTYANPNDPQHDQLGLAWPGAISEPANALMRLFGTPEHPGTFGYGPDYGVAMDNPVRSQNANADDMRTFLESTFGGNALNPVAAVPEGAVAANPSGLIGRMRDIFGLERDPSSPSSLRDFLNDIEDEKATDRAFGSSYLEPGQSIHQSLLDGSRFKSRFNNNGINYEAKGSLKPDGTAYLDWIGAAPSPADSITNTERSMSGLNTLSRSALRQWRDSFIEQFPAVQRFSGERVSGARAANDADPVQTIPALFSDTGSPSLPGAILSGLKDQAQATYRTVRYPFESAVYNGEIPQMQSVNDAVSIPSNSGGKGGFEYMSGEHTVSPRNDIDAFELGEPTTSYLNALLRQRKLSDGTLFSDNSTPSLPGMVVAGASYPSLFGGLPSQQPYPNSLFAQNEQSPADYLHNHQWRPAPGEDYQMTTTPEITRQLDAVARPHVNFLMQQMRKAHPDYSDQYISSEAWKDYYANPSDDFIELKKRLSSPHPY